MDPLSIVGAIAALSQLTTSVAKCSKMIYEVSGKAGQLEEDVKFFASHLNTFEALLSNAHATIRDHFRANRNSPVVKRLQAKQALQNLTIQTKHILRRMKNLRPQSRGQAMNVWERCKWIVKKEARDEICLWMSRIQVHFHMVTESVHYEALIARKENPSLGDEILYNFREEIRRHKRTVKMLSKTIRLMRHRHETKYHDEPLIPGVTVKDLFDNVEEVILELGHSVVSDHPSSTGSSVFSTVSAASTRSSNIQPDQNIRVHHQPHSLPAVEIPTSRQTSRLATVPHEPSTRGRCIVSTSSILGQGNAADEQTTPNLQPSASSHSASSVSEIPEERASDFAVQPPSRKQWAEGDYLDVQPSPIVHTLNESANAEIYAGFVDTHSESTSALVVEGFTTNVISERQAKKLGLDIELFYHNPDGPVENKECLDEPEETSIRFKNDDVQLVIGSVEFTWKTAGVDWRPLRITCLVCEYVPVPTSLIFGQPYINKKTHYANKRRPDRLQGRG